MRREELMSKESSMSDFTAHLDSFARDNLPPKNQWPAFNLDLPELGYPARMNCATELLDKAVAAARKD